MATETDKDQLWHAFVEAGWKVPEDLKVFYTTDILIKLHKKVHPTPFINLTIEDAITEQALEKAKAGHGMMHKSVRRKLLIANIGTIRAYVMLSEAQAVRVFGGSKTKAYRAMEALILQHGLHQGMDPTDGL